MGRLPSGYFGGVLNEKEFILPHLDCSAEPVFWFEQGK
jgi:hypothetical protein